MKKILLIDESKLFRNYLTEVMQGEQFNVIHAGNASDGLLALRSEHPDLVISDFHFTNSSFEDFYKEKKQNTKTADIPVIIVSSRLDDNTLKKLSSYSVKAVFKKPLSLDRLLHDVSEILRIQITFDTTPCIIEAHFNEGMLFIQISEGLNADKIGLLRFKISELLDLYQVSSPGILVLMAGCTFSDGDQAKLDRLFTIIMDTCTTSAKTVKIIAKSPFIEEYIAKHSNYHIKKLEILGSLEEAMEALAKSSGKPGYAGGRIESVISAGVPKKNGDEAIRLDFDMSRLRNQAVADATAITIAVVDDDDAIRNLVVNVFSQLNWNVTAYADGREFVDDPRISELDLVFLDLLTPNLDGLSVLQELRKRRIEIPVVVLSLLNNQQLVVKAIQLGVKGNLIKPIKPERFVLKAFEILKSHIM